MTKLQVLSLGAGVQSSTLALMAATGVITPMPDAAIFADTQAEPESVYRWLAWLETQLPFPVSRVTHGNLAADTVQIKTARESGRRYWDNRLPVFLAKTDGSRGIVWRKCTRDYKVYAIRREIRRLMRAAGAAHTVQRIGISRDEAHRMKDSEVRYVTNQYPLVDLGMSRADCLAWMKQRGYPVPPRSACVFCPYHSDAEWHRLKTEEPEAFAAAVRMDYAIREAAAGSMTIASTPFLHDTLKPLDQIDFDRLDRQSKAQLSLFGNECEGLCGV